MLVVRNYKYRLSPKGTVTKRLAETLDTCRWVYNQVLELRIKAYKDEKKTLSCYECISIAKDFDLKNPVHSQVIQNVSMRVQLAY